MRHPAMKATGLLFALATLGCVGGDDVWWDSGWRWDSPIRPDTGAWDFDGDGWSVADGDCDDQDPQTHPNASDPLGDGVDQDCDGADGHDGDQDGFATLATGGDDCDDTDASIHPGATEIPGDGIDQDCDGKDGMTATAIAVGEGLSCARVESETLCWGDPAHGLLEVPSGDWTELAFGTSVGCVVDADGAASCWGEDELGGLLDGVPTTGFHQLGVGTWHGCALDGDGLPHCWGSDLHGQVSGTPTTALVRLAVGPQVSCGVDAAGKASCWGADFVGQASPPDASFLALDVGAFFGCGIAGAREVLCWGQAPALPVLGEEGAALVDVQVGDHFACALDEEGELSCWGELASAAPDARYAALAVGRVHACGLTLEGLVTCWGSDTLGQLSP